MRCCSWVCVGDEEYNRVLLLTCQGFYQLTYLLVQQEGGEMRLLSHLICVLQLLSNILCVLLCVSVCLLIVSLSSLKKCLL